MIGAPPPPPWIARALTRTTTLDALVGGAVQLRIFRICPFCAGGVGVVIPAGRGCVTAANLLANRASRFRDLGPGYHTTRIATKRRLRKHIAQFTAVSYRVPRT